MIHIFIAALLSFGVAFAQASIEEQNPETVGADSAMSSLREVSIEKFERDGQKYNVRFEIYKEAKEQNNG